MGGVRSTVTPGDVTSLHWPVKSCAVRERIGVYIIKRGAIMRSWVCIILFSYRTYVPLTVA